MQYFLRLEELGLFLPAASLFSRPPHAWWSFFALPLLPEPGS
jgi:hypothetical protein